MDALRIEQLAVRGFRNVRSLDLCPSPKFNVIHGDNGAGKSSVLEAIHYLGGLASFRGARTDDLICLDEPRAIVKARVSGNLVPQSYQVNLSRTDPRKIALDGRKPRSRAAWLTSLQVVLFHPGDLALATGSPDARRSFLDRILEQMDATYSSTLVSYEKALRSRNRLLRAEGVDRRSISAYDPLLAAAGAIIGQTRAQLVADLAPLTEHSFERITAAQLPLAIHYRPRVEPTVAALQRAYEQALEKDLARGYTADGPHADELGFVLRRDVAARHHASQGQHRVIVLALKIAELEVLSRRVGRVPILLLDDVSSELDRARNRRLFEILAGLGGQTFLTTTHPEYILLEQERTDFRAEDGNLTRA